MRRPFYHYHQCEEYLPDGGMWKVVSGPVHADLQAKAAKLMRKPSMFADAMRKAVREWPHSCAMNLLTPSKNRRAWLGHAGCFLATGSPEECTRMAWHTLTAMEQRKANHAADTVIREWKGIAVDSHQLALGAVDA